MKAEVDWEAGVKEEEDWGEGDLKLIIISDLFFVTSKALQSQAQSCRRNNQHRDFWSETAHNNKFHVGVVMGAEDWGEVVREEGG